jgi:hypothetical protein
MVTRSAKGRHSLRRHSANRIGGALAACRDAEGCDGCDVAGGCQPGIGAASFERVLHKDKDHQLRTLDGAAPYVTSRMMP